MSKRSFFKKSEAYSFVTDQRKPFVCFSRNSCGFISNLIFREYTIGMSKSNKVFTVFDWHCKPARLIFNQFDSSTEQRIIETNNEINSAIIS